MIMDDNLYRIYSIDLLRSVAIVLVVLCHSVHRMDNFVDYQLFTVARLGVPFFLIITGYLLVDKRYNASDMKHLYKRLLWLFLVTEIWLIIYAIFLHIIGEQKFDIFFLLKQLIFIEQNNCVVHMWYMPMIVGTYFFIPFLSNGIKDVSPKYVYMGLLFLVVYLDVIQCANQWSSLLWNIPMSQKTNVCFWGGSYGIFLVIGCLLKKYDYSKYHSIICIIGVLSFIIVVAEQMIFSMRGAVYNLWYNDPFLVILASCVSFGVINSKKAFMFGKSRVIYFASKYSFPVFLLHYPLKIMLQRSALWNWNYYYFSLILCFVIIIFLSYFLGVIICKIPKIGKWIVYVR